MILVDRDLTAAGGGGGWTGSADGTRETRFYPLQNWRADVVAIANGTGARIENARYSAYGLPTVISDADFNHDGVVDTDDQDDFDDDFKTLLERADVDWDGDLDSADEALFAAVWTDADNSGLFKGYGDERGHLSIYGLRKGYAGYENDGIIVKLAHVRNRVLDHETGRWTRRDPAGYVDGMNTYSYINDNPLLDRDPSGLVRAMGIDYEFNAFIDDRNTQPISVASGLWQPEPWFLPGRYWILTDGRKLGEIGTSRVSTGGFVDTRYIGTNGLGAHPFHPFTVQGESGLYDPRTGEVRYSTGQPVLRWYMHQAGPCALRIHFAVTAADPFVHAPVQPWIEHNVDLLFFAHGDSVYISAEGSHSNYPSHELIITHFASGRFLMYGKLSPYVSPSATGMIETVKIRTGTLQLRNVLIPPGC